MMKIADSDLCRLCNSCAESLLHLFVECRHVTKIWRELEEWLKAEINLIYIFTATSIILGDLFQSDISTPINVLILVTKSYIFNSAYRNKIPNITQLKRKLNFVFEEELLLYEDINKKLKSGLRC